MNGAVALMGDARWLDFAWPVVSPTCFSGIRSVRPIASDRRHLPIDSHVDSGERPFLRGEAVAAVTWRFRNDLPARSRQAARLARARQYLLRSPRLTPVVLVTD
jgi:hypothetical protein